MRGAVLGAAAALLIASSAYVPAASPDTGQVTRANATTTADGNSVTAAGAAARAARADTFATSGRGGGQRAPVLVRHMRAEVCGVYSANRATYWPCDPGVTRDHTGECGETTFTTTTPGHPYPDQDVSYPYERLGTTRITSSSFDVVEVTSHLVRGNCTHYPDDPGC